MTKNLIDSESFYFKDIPGADSWTELLRVGDGDLSDTKYAVRNTNGEQFFVRLAEPTRYDRIKGEYEHLQTISGLGVPVPSPIRFGLCGNGQSLYLQTDWIYGKPGSEVMGSLDSCLQYELGVTAGLYIKMIHACPSPGRTSKAWETAQIKRWKAIQQAYRKCAHKIPCVHRLFGMIDNNIRLVQDRPQRLLHGDFHIGNIMLTQERTLKLVDLHGWLYGDPLYDMASVIGLIGQQSRAFAVGILDCYFVYLLEDPTLRLMNVYAGMALAEQVILAGDSEKQAQTALDRVQIFMRELQGCRQACPTWYKRLRDPLIG